LQRRVGELAQLKHLSHLAQRVGRRERAARAPDAYVVGGAHAALGDVAAPAGAHLVNLVVAEPPGDQHDDRAGHEQQQPRQLARAAVARKQHGDQREERADAVEREGHAALRPAALKELVVDVLAVALEERLARDEAARDGEAGVYDRQREGHQGDGDGDGGRSLLRPRHGERREQEAREERARVAEEDGGGVEVVA
jgi:hypothetical protein